MPTKAANLPSAKQPATNGKQQKQRQNSQQIVQQELQQQQLQQFQLVQVPMPIMTMPNGIVNGIPTSSHPSTYDGQQPMVLIGGANGDEQPQQQQFFQVVQIPADSTELFSLMDSNGNIQNGGQQHIVLQLPEGIQLTPQFLENSAEPSTSAPSSSSTAVLPIQMMNLSDGTTTLIPIGSFGGEAGTTAFQLAANGQIFQAAEQQHFVDGVEQKVQRLKNECQFVEAAAIIDPSMAATFAASPASENSGSQMEPVYVNEKQYARILKRRAARAKLEMEGRIPKQRRKYLHESRHRHAQNRARREGGKFDSSGQLFRADSASSSHRTLSSSSMPNGDDNNSSKEVENTNQ